ncbi:MAG: response regulator [Sedimentisphaerales bacterium]|nr:response regulator [Sedimentisphaerales bacterium]
METLGSTIVLLVEDDPGDQKLIKYALSHQPLNNSLKVVGTGEEALEYLEAGNNGDEEKPRPDLILLDLNMPGMGGKEFLRRMKADPKSCDIPVVIVSTSNSESDIEDTYKLHAAGYIQKSPSPDELRRIIRKLTHYWFATSLMVKRKYQPQIDERERIQQQNDISEQTSKEREQLMNEYKAATILLVEDDPGDRKLIKKSLNNNRIINDLHTCSNAEEAIEYLQKSFASDPECPMPDLVLLDLNMPGMGGKEFLRSIKEKECTEAIPVVILTTSDSDKDILESYRLQAAGYIKKPVSLPEFQRVVSELTDYWFVVCKHVEHSRELSNERNFCTVS